MKDLQIDFTITKHDSPIRERLNCRERLIRGEVMCVIQPPGLPEAIGLSRCSASDVWDEQRGRKLAMERAVKDAAREFRGALWKKAFELGRVGR